MTLLIKNGRVIDPAAKQDMVADVLVRDGKIAKVMPDIQESADRQIDAGGCFVMPGFIDLHVHLRDPGFERKETVVTGAAAAAHGGYTTIVAMPNTKPVVDNADVVNYVHNKAKSVTKVNILQAGAITKKMEGLQLADIEKMVRAGSPAISEDGKSVMNAYVLQEAMKLANRLDIPVLSHCEDKNLVNGGVVNADENAQKSELPGITNSVENVIIIRDVQLAKETGARLHLCHCSTKESVEIVKMAKARGNRVSAEVCPHHFTLSSDDMPTGDTNYKMNPPLRTKEDVEALRQGLKQDIIDVIATDHAPHAKDEKNDSMLRAPFGIVGLETAAALTYTELVLGGYLTPMQMAEKMSYHPARVIGIDKGSLQEGKTADIVIFDPEKTYTIDASRFASKSRNTPFHGRTVTGAVRATIAGGEIIYEAT
ncbi:Dihydroorotase [Eubacterium plexicaudatum ASF492]|uniref:Dihydroorotase n=1 Tax=Eubacterium plexicaudatum ASF492 TaxID=1235802 RepID=N2A663_9FIRM|nr:Dihydroorotase [Eubacterium plexicaudatum ASF492]